MRVYYNTLYPKALYGLPYLKGLL